MEKIGEIIKIGRVKKGLSQEELGKKLGISKNSISAWETGAKSPSCEMLFKVANILDLVPDLFPGHGWGKHTVAMVLASRLLVRKEFSDGVFYLNLEGIKDVDSFCSLLAQEIFSNTSSSQESMSYIASHISGKGLFVLENVDGLLQEGQREKFRKAL